METKVKIFIKKKFNNYDFIWINRNIKISNLKKILNKLLLIKNHNSNTFIEKSQKYIKKEISNLLFNI